MSKAGRNATHPRRECPAAAQSQVLPGMPLSELQSENERSSAGLSRSGATEQHCRKARRAAPWSLRFLWMKSQACHRSPILRIVQCNRGGVVLDFLENPLVRQVNQGVHYFRQRPSQRVSSLCGSSAPTCHRGGHLETGLACMRRVRRRERPSHSRRRPLSFGPKLVCCD